MMRAHSARLPRKASAPSAARRTLASVQILTAKVDEEEGPRGR